MPNDDAPDRLDPVGRPTVRQLWRELGLAPWTRVTAVAGTLAVIVTALVAVVSLGREDEFLLGDLASVAFGVFAAVTLGAGIDVSLPPASRTLARYLSLVAVGYLIAALWVSLAALL